MSRGHFQHYDAHFQINFSFLLRPIANAKDICCSVLHNRIFKKQNRAMERTEVILKCSIARHGANVLN